MQFAGAAEELFFSTDPEVLIEGPAGTGKTVACLQRSRMIAVMYPGCRILFCRQTRASMSESVLVEWESTVLGHGHPVLAGGAKRHGRKVYEFPNGSTIVCGGLDNSDRVMSTQYDVIVVFEATETLEEDIEKLTSRLRNNMILPENRIKPLNAKQLAEWPRFPKGHERAGECMAFTQLMCDCNPGPKSHWLNKRANEVINDPKHTRHGKHRMKRLLSRHKDNPSLTPEYLERLSTLKGVRRDRLYKGLWVSAEGMIYDNWDAEVHLVNRMKDGKPSLPPFVYYFGSADQGFRKAGVLQVWGMTREARAYRVAEVYARGQNDDWWADRAAEFQEEFDLLWIACDPADPKAIDFWNKKMAGQGRHPRPEGHGIARGVEKGKFLQGARHMHSLLERDHTGLPAMFYVRDSNRFIDHGLIEDGLPWKTEDEFEGYLWRKIKKDGDEEKEEPQPGVPDHGMDASRYGMLSAFRLDPGEAEEDTTYERGTLGDYMEHAGIPGG